MKGRLFWKILFGFWLTFLLIIVSLWLLAAALQLRPVPPESWLTDRVARPVVTELADALEIGGKAAFDKARLHLPADDRSRTSAVPLGPILRGQFVERPAVSPTGEHYRVLYRYDASSPGQSGDRLGVPFPVVLFGVLGGFVFSFVLAWYVTKPMKLLRDGFGRMAAGDLNVRLSGRLGRRRDEVADLAIAFDIMADRLEQLLTARDRLLHDVSHELRSPLSRLQLAIGLLRQDSARYESALERIEREASLLEKIVHELLTLARAESGGRLSEDYFDPIGVIENVLGDAQYEAQTKNVRVVLQAPDTPEEKRPSVCGSPELFRRAIENIVRNALRFSLPNGDLMVTVGLDVRSQMYKIDVADEGPGAQSADFETLFDPFVQGDMTGYGLGLAITKRAIVAHGGSITARNRSTGGFVVEITVPCRSTTTS